MDNKLRLIELFSGIGFTKRGIENSKLFDVIPVATSDIDTNAVISYAAIHCGLTNEMIDNYTDYPSREEMVKWLDEHDIGYDPMKDKRYDWNKKLKSKKKEIEKVWLACMLANNLGTITKIESLPECDLLTWTSPCTDISAAGKICGFTEDSGTRSSLLWHVIRLLRDYKERQQLPKYLLFENVKNIVSKRFIGEFEQVVSCLDDIGYNSYWKVINGKECGVPQSRERIFMISIRKDLDNGKFEFPQPFDTGVRLKDILIKDIDEKYYITNEKAQSLIRDLVINGKVIVPEVKQ